MILRRLYHVPTGIAKVGDGVLIPEGGVRSPESQPIKSIA
jgi:hypothetical protein